MHIFKNRKQLSNKTILSLEDDLDVTLEAIACSDQVMWFAFILSIMFPMAAYKDFDIMVTFVDISLFTTPQV